MSLSKDHIHSTSNFGADFGHPHRSMQTTLAGWIHFGRYASWLFAAVKASIFDIFLLNLLQDAQKVTHLLRLRSTNGAAPEVILMSTGSKLRRTAGPSSDPAMVHSGSEVHLMVQAHQELAASGVKVRPGFRDFPKSCH